MNIQSLTAAGVRTHPRQKHSPSACRPGSAHSAPSVAELLQAAHAEILPTMYDTKVTNFPATRSQHGREVALGAQYY